MCFHRSRQVSPRSQRMRCEILSTCAALVLSLSLSLSLISPAGCTGLYWAAHSFQLELNLPWAPGEERRLWVVTTVTWPDLLSVSSLSSLLSCSQQPPAWPLPTNTWEQRKFSTENHREIVDSRDMYTATATAIQARARAGSTADMGGPRISFPRQHYKGGREGDTTFAILNIFIARSRASHCTGKQLTACVWYFCPTGYFKSLSRLGRLKPTQFLSMPSNWLGLWGLRSQHKDL